MCSFQEKSVSLSSYTEMTPHFKLFFKEAVHENFLRWSYFLILTFYKINKIGHQQLKQYTTFAIVLL